MDTCAGSSNVKEIVVVGAGPHALTLVTKLLEERVDPLEEIPQNPTLFRQNGGKARFSNNPPARLAVTTDRDLLRFEKHSRSKLLKAQRCELLSKISVIDPHGCWMKQWEQQFAALGIPMLRSTISAHPDPIDGQMLRLFSRRVKRLSSELIQLGLERTEEYSGPWQVPSTTLFGKFCRWVVERYELNKIVRKAKVAQIVPFVRSDHNFTNSTGKEEVWYKVHLDDGSYVTTKKVVVATGSLNQPNMPHWACSALECNCNVSGALPSLLHSNDVIAKYSLVHPQHCQGKTTLIVGGGLTAGHLALRALRSGPSARVILATRREISLRQFDLELCWMGTKRTCYLEKFWKHQSMSDRFKVVKQSKNGGSITPEIFAELQKFEKLKQLQMLECIEVIGVEWDTKEHEGSDESNRSSKLSDPVIDGKWRVLFDSGDEIQVDAIWCATGTTTDFNTDPLFESVREFCNDHKREIPTESGLPILTEDLRIREDLDLFVMGNYASLRVGPGALNLMGGKAAASRISHGIGFGLERSNHTKWTARDNSRLRFGCSNIKHR